MDNTFTRGLIGFVTLTAAIALMASTALWAIETYANGANWAAIIVIVIAMAAEIGVYGSTLHDQVYDWIHEPKRRK